ncbi:MAG: hypothetical protein A2202_07570 [Bdellovibrionales bacterium RIFOXYA1_FULL_36_14]|nr:MAG: hypothetical protein A2202_07570 [Bdellovibrionales bacterium RIFOXYA1_FULL_36_14]
MNRNKYELIQDRNDIGSILDKLLEYNSEVIISEDTTEKRTLYKSNIVFVNHFNHEMVLKPANFGHPFSISGKYRFYITNEQECMHFTCTLGKTTFPRFLVLKWPVSIFQQNTRKNKRISLDHKNFLVNFSNFSLNANLVKETYQEAKLMDISKAGFGLSVDEEIASFLRPNDCLIFTYINEKPLKDKLSGNVVYIKKINPIMSSNNYTVGIKFNEETRFNEILYHLGQKTDNKDDLNELKRLF